MGERVAWSREDIIVAYALYCITPLNDIRPSNKLIQQVACGFSHSVSSLVMRMKILQLSTPIQCSCAIK